MLNVQAIIVLSNCLSKKNCFPYICTVLPLISLETTFMYKCSNVKLGWNCNKYVVVKKHGAFRLCQEKHIWCKNRKKSSPIILYIYTYRCILNGHVEYQRFLVLLRTNLCR